MAVVAGEVSVDNALVVVDAEEGGEGVVGEEVHIGSHCRHKAIVAQRRNAFKIENYFDHT